MSLKMLEQLTCTDRRGGSMVMEIGADARQINDSLNSVLGKHRLLSNAR